MATATAGSLTIGPADAGRRVPFVDFIEADFEDGHLYELARGVVVMTEVPGPNHGLVVMRLADLLALYARDHPGVIAYRAGGMECRLRLPGMESDRHPDQAVYLTPPPAGPRPWTRWAPALVVEVVSEGGEERDYVEKAEEYLKAGVLEYWAIDPTSRTLRLHLRAGDTWEVRTLKEDEPHEPHFLPGLVVRGGDVLGSF